MIGFILSPVLSLIRFHKLKVLCVLMISLGMMIVLFPNEDLSDAISAFVFRKTATYVQMDNLGFTVIPGPGFEADDVLIESRGMPALRAGNIHATASFMKALTAKIGVSAKIKRLFGGDIDLEYEQSGTAKSGAPYNDITLHAEKMELDSLMGFLAAANFGGPKIHGKLRLDINKLRIDHLFSEQPSAVVSLEIPDLSFPTQTLMTQMGPQPIPTLDLGRTVIKNAKLNDGVLEISELTLGDPKGEFYAKVKGTLGLQIKKSGPVVNPEIANINLNLKVSANKEFVSHNRDILGGFLALMGNCKQDTATGIDINCNLKVMALGQVPIFTPLTEKF